MRAALRFLLLLLAGVVLLCAYDFTSLVQQGYVSDFSAQHVVDEASRAELERYARAVERSTGTQMAFVVIDSLQGEPIEDVANAIFRKWGVGSKKNNDGILLLLSVGDRRHRLEVGYGLEPILPDGFDGSVLRAMRDQLRAGRYGEAMLDAAHTIGTRISQSKGVEIAQGGGGYRPRQVRSRRHIPWIPIAIGFVVLLVLARSSRGGGGGGFGGGGGGGLLAGLLLGNLLGGGRGGGWSGGASGGGGFGGYDSGDGFGGFGGGDSGGGGASSDW